MEILRTCLDEIGLSGLEGCTLGELWEFVLKREPPVPFILDSPTKSFIWTHLLRCVEEAKTVQVFQLAEPRELVQTTSTHSLSSRVFKCWVEYCHPFPYRLISIPEKGIRGSCASFNKRKDITKEILQDQMDLSAVIEKYGDSLVLVGSQDLRQRSLLPRDKDPCIDISDVQFCLLEVVGSSRHHGIMRTFVTTKYMKIDARSTFHHCKVLEQAGLVTVKSGVIARGGRSQVIHLLLLSRYRPPDLMETNAAEQLCSILQTSPHHTLPIQTVYERMGKRVKSVKSVLIKKGFIETVTMGEVSPDIHPPEVARLKAYRLLKPYEEDKLGGEEEMEEEEEKDVDPSCQTPVVFELPLEMQGYRLIDSYGPDGISNSDFCSKGLAVDMRTCRMIAKALIRSSRVVTIVNDDTSIRKIKLISARHVTKNKMYERLQAEKAKSGVQDLELAIRTGDDYFQSYGKKVKSEPSRDGGEAPVVKMMDDGFLLPWQQVEGQDEEVTQALMGEGKRVEGEGLQGEDISLVDVEASELESQAASSTGTPVCRSPFPDLDPRYGIGYSLTPESASRRPSQALMTYHQLKRTNIIVKYVESVRVLQGIVDLCKHVREVELKEGREQTVDKKTIKKLMVRLERDKRICHREVELKLGDQTQPIELYYVPDTSEDELTAAVEKALRTFQGIVRRKELREKPREKKKKGRKKKKVEEIEEEEDEEEEEGDSSESENEQLATSERMSFSLPNVATKFQRLRHFHYFLWILAHGFSSFAKVKGDERVERGEGERMLSEPCESSELTTQQPCPPSFLSPTNFPWVEVVHQLPMCGSRGPGWLSYNDVLYHMPVSLIALLIKLWPFQHLSPKYFQYFEVVEHRNQLLHQLPKKLRRHIISRGRDVACVNRLMEQLEDMKLITLDGFNPRDRANVYIHLNQAASILDTSTAKPRRSFFLEEARPLFKSIHHQFCSLADLERYWFQLQSICLQTPIILGGKLQRKIQRERDQAKLSKPDLLHVKDTHALPYTALGRASLRDKFKKFNRRGFGAGGLPPLFFSHANRNWTQIIGRTGKELLPRVGELPEVEEEVYGPGMGLAKLPQIEMRSGGGDGTELLNIGHEGASSGGVEGREERRVVEAGEAVSLPPAKQLKLLAKPGLKADIVRVLGSQVKQHEGGRGQKRARVKRVIEAAKKVKKARESMARYKASPRTTSIIVDRPGEEVEEEEERDRLMPERVCWNQHEDSFLLLAYLTSAILNRKGQPVVTYSKIKEALHKEFHTSRNKSAAMVKRHILTLKRRRFFSSIEISVAETLQDLDSLEEETAPKLTFEAILEFVKNKYKSQQEQLLSHTDIILPSTLMELYENYEVVESKEHKQVSLPSVETDQEINRAQVADLIIAALGAEESSYDQFKAFKLFESFPEVDVRAAFEGLRSQYLIKQKRSVLGIPRHKGPLETQSYDLSANFYSRLEQHYPPELFHEVDEFMQHLLCQSTADMQHSSDIRDTNQEAQAMETGPSSGSDGSSEVNVAAVSNAAVSLDSSGPIRVESEAAKGGTVAALVGMLFDTSKWSPVVSCDPVLAAPPLEPREGSEGGGVTRQLLQSALEEEEESEDEASVETLVQHPSRLAGTGLSTLLQMDEAATLRHGYVDVELGLNCAKLLDPLPEEELQATEARRYHFKNDGDIVGDPLSLDTYLNTCETHLGFSEADVEFARMLYEVVDGGGERGVPMAKLQSSLILNSYGHHVFGLEDHIQSLLNFQMVHLVGINRVLVVSHAHCGRWLMSSEGGGDHRLPYRPWSAISSSDPNATLLNNYREGILAHIMAHPGVTLLQLAAHFSGVLHLNGLREILQSLELEDCVRSQRLLQLTESCADPESLETICYETVLR